MTLATLERREAKPPLKSPLPQHMAAERPKMTVAKRGSMRIGRRAPSALSGSGSRPPLSELSTRRQTTPALYHWHAHIALPAHRRNSLPPAVPPRSAQNAPESPVDPRRCETSGTIHSPASIHRQPTYPALPAVSPTRSSQHARSCGSPRQPQSVHGCACFARQARSRSTRSSARRPSR